MKKVISISEVVGPVQVRNDLCEVWASADASAHERKLEVKLDSFLRRASDNKQLSATWLPESQRVVEVVDPEEASLAAKEIFANWVQRVRRAVREHSTVETSLPS
jgi:hypothetical protein